MDFGLAHDNNGIHHNRNVRSLPGVYALTGCDYSSAFFKKGKKKALQVINENKEYNKVFSLFGEYELSEDNIVSLEKFVCHLY